MHPISHNDGYIRIARFTYSFNIQPTGWGPYTASGNVVLPPLPPLRCDFICNNSNGWTFLCALASLTNVSATHSDGTTNVCRLLRQRLYSPRGKYKSKPDFSTVSSNIVVSIVLVMPKKMPDNAIPVPERMERNTYATWGSTQCTPVHALRIAHH